MHERVVTALEFVWITRADSRIVLFRIDLLRTLFRILFREQTLDRFFRRVVRIAVVKIPVGERQAHCLV